MCHIIVHDSVGPPSPCAWVWEPSHGTMGYDRSQLWNRCLTGLPVPFSSASSRGTYPGLLRLNHVFVVQRHSDVRLQIVSVLLDHIRLVNTIFPHRRQGVNDLTVAET